MLFLIVIIFLPVCSALPFWTF